MISNHTRQFFLVLALRGGSKAGSKALKDMESITKELEQSKLENEELLQKNQEFADELKEMRQMIEELKKKSDDQTKFSKEIDPELEEVITQSPISEKSKKIQQTDESSIENSTSIIRCYNVKP